MIIVQKLKERYPVNGSFYVTPSSSIANNIKTQRNNKIVEGKGVYIFTAKQNNQEKTMYIGKAGTIKTSGEWAVQNLFGRISNKNYQPVYKEFGLKKSVNRQKFFDKVFELEKADAIGVYWFVSWDANKFKELPGLAEALALQSYFDMYGRLPEWNNKF